MSKQARIEAQKAQYLADQMALLQDIQERLVRVENKLAGLQETTIPTKSRPSKAGKNELEK